MVRAQPHAISARKLWIGFAVGSAGRIIVDDGARRALAEQGRSLLSPGVTEVIGSFDSGEAVEVCGLDGTVFAKGLAAIGSDVLSAIKGKRARDLLEDHTSLVIHRDDMVILPR